MDKQWGRRVRHFVEWSRKKGFKSYYVFEAKNALENGGEITILQK